MYVHLSEIILIQDKNKLRSGDRAIYTAPHPLTGQDVLTPDHTAKQAQRYGMFYFDSMDNMCVVPDVWTDHDAWTARKFI